MKVRGNRECRACGTQWSYYETGSVACPECGSLDSRGVGERAEHTAGPAALDLSAARGAVDAEPLREVADRAAEAAAEYLRQAGFVHAGELQPLSETYLAAAELRRVGATLSRAMRADDAEWLYFLSLLDGAEDGQRSPPEEVPEGLWAARGLAVAAAADAYVSDLRRVREEPGPDLAPVLSTLRARRKRIEALDGDVDPAEAERVVRALRDVAAYVREDDETALVRARELLE
ncbi:hypothetical protein BRD09_06135 [Halobacteriales archaeon SW_10_68_16]|jgi:uncharacterized Zn finger protein (UPF0148 family)|nr:MAG: hypothetical protein BRD09_06135 [Halobacteriales archaeon SW_10_68_16]